MLYGNHSTTPGGAGNINNFDFLRFLLAAVVAFSHIIYLSGAEALQPFAPFFPANMAVCGFFIISGLLISSSYFRSSSLKRYFTKRARRLLPAYIFVVMTCALFLGLTSNLDIGDYFSHPEWWRYVGANLVFLNFLQPTLPGVFTQNVIPEVNGALWSIKIEIAFYLVIPLLPAWLYRRKNKALWLVVIYIASITYRLAFEEMERLTGRALWLQLSYQLPGFMCYFICGIAACFYYEKSKRISLPVAMLAAGWFLVEEHFFLTLLKPVALAIIILYIAYHFKGLNHFGKYGDYSYGIYIFHFPLIQLAIHFGWFRYFGNAYTAALLLFGGCILCGMLSWHLLEKHFLHRRT